MLGSVSGSRLFENDRLALTQYSHLNCDWFEPWRETTDHVSLEICLDGGSRPSPLRALINQAVQSGHSRVNTNGRPGVIYEYDFQRQIGTNIDGQPATRLRVIVNKRNQVVTAFPF